jgi:transcriptional regulator with XRE-family HTH domain
MVSRNVRRKKSKYKPLIGITQREVAQRLGVNRSHLSLVLNGHRQSRSLTARYLALVAQAEAESTPAPAR